MKRHGYNGTSLHGRRLRVLLSWCNPRSFALSALVFVPSIVSAQWNSTDRLHLEDIEDSVGSTRSDVNAILNDTQDIAHFIELIATDADNASYDLDNIYSFLTGTLSSAGDVNGSVNSQGYSIRQGQAQQLGALTTINRDMRFYHGQITNFFMDGSTTLLPSLAEGSYRFSFYNWADPGGYGTDSFAEFLSLTLGSLFDMEALDELESDDPFNAWDHAYELDRYIYDGYPASVSFAAWQAEAWRRQLAALGATTNDWSSFTNSSQFTSMQGVFEDPAFRSTYQPSNFAYSVTHDDETFVDGTNDVSTSGGVLAKLPSLQFDILTNEITFANMTGLTNYSVRIQQSDIMPSYAGQWLIRLGRASDANYKFGVFEKDLSGSLFAQWAERFPDWIKMICDILFYVYSAYMYLYTASYAMRVLPE